MTTLEQKQQAAAQEYATSPEPFSKRLAFIAGAEWAEAQQRWIPVTEKVPEESGLVLGCMKDTLNIYICYYKKSRNLFQVWGAGRDPYEDMKVTHWMPLPEPPAQEGGQDE